MLNPLLSDGGLVVVAGGGVEAGAATEVSMGTGGGGGIFVDPGAVDCDCNN
jgi:hypothetical protein